MNTSQLRQLKTGSKIHLGAHKMYTVIKVTDATITISGGKNHQNIYTQDFANFQNQFPDAFLVRTWQELASEALFVGNACNLGGVVRSFAKVIDEVRARLESEGKMCTNDINSHPVCVLFAQAIGNITRCENTKIFTDAYNWCLEQTKE